MPHPLRRLFRLATGRDRLEAEVDDELDLHQTLVAEELAGQGIPPDEARRRAATLMGDRDVLVRRIMVFDRAGDRSRRRGERMGKWWSDLRLAVRGFRRDPWFALAAVTLVAVGIGANIAVFSILNAAFFHPLPYPDFDRIVSVREARGGATMPIAGRNLRDWQARATQFTHLAGYYQVPAILGAADRPERVRAAFVSRSFTGVMGLAPFLGRWFSAEEAKLGGAPAAVLAEGFWRRRFGGDRGVIGTVIKVDGRSLTVVGVMPAALDFPVGSDLWTPVEPWDDNPNRTAHNFRAVGRLVPGLTVEGAMTSLSALTRQIVADEPVSEYLADGASVVPLREALLGQSPGVLRLLQGAVALLLVIAVLNLTTLLLARAAKRQDEVGMILTLGAGRSDLIRRFVVESALLTAAGAAVGLSVWVATRTVLEGSAAAFLPFLRRLPLDPLLIGFVVLVVAVVGVVSGLVPALWVGRAVERGTHRRATQRVVGPNRLMRLLVGAEVAATFVLLIGAGLLVRSLDRMLDQRLGFDLDHRVITMVELPTGDGSPYGDGERHRLFFDQLMPRISSIPGVTSVAVATAVPLVGTSPDGSARIQGESSADGGPAAVSDFRVVSPGFFSVLGIPVVRGRDFADTDGGNAPYVAVVSEAFVATHLRGGEPLGRLVRFPGMDGAGEDRWATIVGVAGDVRQDGPGDQPRPAIYYSFRQRPQPFRTMIVVARVSGESRPVLDGIRSMLAEVEPRIPFEGGLLAASLREATAAPRFRTVVLGAFAAAALLLAGVGLFGVVGFVVARRTRELGLKIALGASPGRVARTAASHALAPVLGGIVAGGVASLFLGRVVRGFLFDVSTVDPGTFLGAATLIALVAILACVGPVARALGIDPASALRSE